MSWSHAVSTLRCTARLFGLSIGGLDCDLSVLMSWFFLDGGTMTRAFVAWGAEPQPAGRRPGSAENLVSRGRGGHPRPRGRLRPRLPILLVNGDLAHRHA